VHVEILLNTNTANTNNKALTAAEMYHPKKAKPPPCLKLHEVQTLDLRKSVIVDAMMVNDNVFAIMGDRTIRLYSRPQLAYVPPPIIAVKTEVAAAKPARKKWISKKDKAAMLAAGIDPNAETTTTTSAEVSAEPSVASVEAVVPKYNSFTRTGKLNLFYGQLSCHKLPSLLRLAGKDKFLIGFDDGTVQVMYCPSIVDPSLVKKTDTSGSTQVTLGTPHSTEENAGAQKPAQGTLAVVLCEFQAHFVAEKADHTVPGTADINLESKHNTGLIDTTKLRLGGNSAENSLVLDDASEVTGDGTVGKLTKRSRLGVQAAFLCPWLACSGTKGNGYQFELLTLGSDRRVAHWGVRFKEDQQDVILVPHFATLLPASVAKIGVAADDHTLDGSQEDLEENEESALVGVAFSVDERSIAGLDTPMESDLLGVRKLFLCISLLYFVLSFYHKTVFSM